MAVTRARILGVIALLSAAAWALAGRGLVNYDTLYAVVWGRDLAHGRLPDYALPLVPTPHPLATLGGMVLAPLSGTADRGVHGEAATTVVLVGAFVALGVLGWVVYRLGAAWFNPAAGALAAAIVLTRRPVLDYGARAYVDIPYVALVLGALLVETRRPRAGAPVLALLAVAGLLRPEAWLFSFAYLAWMWRAPRSRDPWLVALAVAAPVLWALSDLVVTGDPLHSLHGTAHLAVANGRRRHVWQVPYWTAQYFGFILREPLVAAVPLGLAFAYVYRLRRAWLPLVAAATLTTVFVAGPLFGLPLIGRYVRTPAELLCLFYGLAVAGFTLLPSGPARRRWQVAGMVALACSVVYLPWHAAMLRDLHRFTARDAKLYGDLQRIAQAPRMRAAFAACGPLATADHRPIPYLRYWLGGDPGSVGTVERHLSPLGRLLLVPRRSKIAKGFYGPAFPQLRPPAGWRVLAQDRSYRLYAAPGCVTAPPS